MPSPTVVVLDDDPTGTQTVHGVPVVTAWDTETLAAELRSGAPAFFILTNTRALPTQDAVRINREIGANLRAAQTRTTTDGGGERPFVVISRSDSTLRGHFPAETDALKEALGIPDAPILLCPYFGAGGRITRGDVHYLRQGEDILIPVGETEFARDAAFGYRSSNLRAWVAEKAGGRVSAGGIHSVSLETIRERGASGVSDNLLAVPPSGVCILNCETDEDLAVLAAGVRDAERQGGVFLYRTAAGFVAARAGIPPRPLLTAEELALPATEGGGGGGVLVAVGSYVSRTSEQLAHLLRETRISAVEVSVEQLLSSGDGAGDEIGRAAEALSGLLSGGRDAVLYTSRELRSAGDLDVGKVVSTGMVEIVRRLSVRPHALVAKGGITSSDLATDALRVRRADVLGQVAPGVPAWRLGPESRWPGLLYIVFPGNVGTVDTLTQVYTLLKTGVNPSEP